MKTLIINDQAFELALLAPALTQRGARVIGATDNVADAMDLFELHKPKVVIVDIRFNKQHAIDLCKEFRSINPLVGLIIIADCPDLRILGITVGEILYGSQLILKSAANVVELIYQSIALSILAAKSKQTYQWAGQEDIINGPQFVSILAGLTDIQIETMRLLGSGLSNSEISRVRFVTEKSVEQIVTKISQYFRVGSDPTKNQRVLLAGQYFKWVGALRK